MKQDDVRSFNGAETDFFKIFSNTSPFSNGNNRPRGVGYAHSWGHKTRLYIVSRPWRPNALRRALPRGCWYDNLRIDVNPS